MEVFTDKIGPRILKGEEEVDIEHVLKDKEVIGFYFSAQWCPPCRGFTPKLAEFYTNHKDRLKFEVIFISSDRDEESFKGYFGKMPWHALPYSDRETKDDLCKEYDVKGIPYLVLLNKDGSTITQKGREEVTSHPDGENFPWNTSQEKTKFMKQ